MSQRIRHKLLYALIEESGSFVRVSMSGLKERYQNEWNALEALLRNNEEYEMLNSLKKLSENGDVIIFTRGIPCKGNAFENTLLIHRSDTYPYDMWRDILCDNLGYVEADVPERISATA